MTPLVLLVGFLGSGKTTLLKQLLPRLRERCLDPHVIVNDYQNARVDAAQLRDLAAEISAISGDCVCCGSRDELLTELENFQHLPGRLMIVEANGTTDSEMLIEFLSLEPALRRFSLPLQISVVDAQRWQKRFWHNALEREQARTASHLFLSRMDVVDKSRLDEVGNSLQRHRIGGERVGVEELTGQLAAISEQLATSAERRLESPGPISHHHDHDHNHDHDHHFASLELPLPDRVDKGMFSRLLRSLPEEVIRAKGLVRFTESPNELFIFQKVDRFDEPQFFAIGHSPRMDRPLALFIGPHLPDQTLRSDIASLTSPGVG